MRYLNRHELERKFSDCLVIEAVTCEDAMRRAEGVRLDAVLTDHHLSDSDGAKFIATLRERGVHCPIVMVTASSDPKVRERALAAGASHVFTPSDMNFAEFLRHALHARN